MKFKSLISCCYAIVCFYSDAVPPVPSQEPGKREGKLVLYTIEKSLPNGRRLSRQPKKICTKKKEEIFDEKTVAAEQLINLGRSEISQSNISLDHDERDVIEARCLFLATIRNMVISRKFQKRLHIESMILKTDIEKCQRDLQILENQKKESEKNIEEIRQEAVIRYLLLQSEISLSNNSQDHERRDVIEARCLFLDAIRDMMTYRQRRNRLHIISTILKINLEKYRRDLQILENQKKESEKNIEEIRQKAAIRYLQLKMIQRKKAKL